MKCHLAKTFHNACPISSSVGIYNTNYINHHYRSLPQLLFLSTVEVYRSVQKLYPLQSSRPVTGEEQSPEEKVTECTNSNGSTAICTCTYWVLIYLTIMRKPLAARCSPVNKASFRSLSGTLNALQCSAAKSEAYVHVYHVTIM